jgi:low temperature requirement protein LtrA
MQFDSNLGAFKYCLLTTRIDLLLAILTTMLNILSQVAIFFQLLLLLQLFYSCILAALLHKSLNSENYGTH